ncbi:hypothetical protein [Siphonobacter sp. SORGH_AS_1065]|uniref:hypothetical protein n=1 Tax=Siphonobacter sp. SORGH_AS_1065 TaxID=3041795 RepID=UPI00278681D6|nr:hypothetical protein [Siphonobacter sp. SORGH_AS_1065]MDQ1086405.1 hypothetical protein [Siphonobacter sp. SORGH_AS_1065]
MAAGRINRSGKNVKTLDKRIYWKDAYFQKIESEWKMIVPFTLQEEIYYKSANGLNFAYSNISFLTVMKKNGNYIYEIVTKIPDEDYLNWEEGKKFSGTIFVEDIYGNFIKGFQTTADQKTYRITTDNRAVAPSISYAFLLTGIAAGVSLPFLLTCIVHICTLKAHART